VGSYNVEITRSAGREIEGLTLRDRERVIHRIEGLATDPRPSGSRKLAGREAYRVRQGDFRVVYTVDDKSRKIVVLAAVHRRDAYR
jgi:mRNA interferase RelE/StbE